MLTYSRAGDLVTALSSGGSRFSDTEVALGAGQGRYGMIRACTVHCGIVAGEKLPCFRAAGIVAALQPGCEEMERE